MIPSSDTQAKAERKIWTAAEKNRAVKLFHNRGERTVKEVCAQIGVNMPNLYHWVHKHEADGPFADKPNGKPGTAIVRAKPASTPRKREQLEINLSSPTPIRASVPQPLPLSMSERDELILLRAEVVRLRAVVATACNIERGK